MSKKKIFTYGNEKPLKKEMLYNELIDQYEEIEPYAKNEKTGEILNNSPKKKFKKIEPMNIYQLIQSNGDEADLTTKIKNMSNPNELKQRNGIYIDISNIGNLHQEHEKTKKLEQELNKATLEQKLMEQKLKEQKLKEQAIKEYQEKEKEKNNGTTTNPTNN